MLGTPSSSTICSDKPTGKNIEADYTDTATLCIAHKQWLKPWFDLRTPLGELAYSMFTKSATITFGAIAGALQYGALSLSARQTSANEKIIGNINLTSMDGPTGRNTSVFTHRVW